MKAKLITLFIVAFTVSACSSAQVAKGKNNVDSFIRITSSAGIDVHFSHANSHTIQVETDDENLSKLDISVNDKSLIIAKKKREYFKKNTQIKVYVTAPVLNDIALSGGADFYAGELRNSDKLNLGFSGGADCDIDKLDANECNIAFSGGADCDIKQVKAQKLNLAFSGGSDGEIDITNANELNIAASGGADVEVSGKAKNVSVAVSGGGDVNTKGLTAENMNRNKK